MALAERAQPGPKGLLVATDAHEGQKGQEDVIEHDVERNRRADVVALAAVDDGAGLERDHEGADAQEHSGRGHGQGADLHEDIRDGRHKGDDHADHQEAAHAAKILLRHQRIGAHGKEDCGGAAEGHHNRTGPPELQIGVQDGAERKTHEARQGEGQHNAHAAVLRLFDAPEQPEVGEKHPEAQVGHIERHGRHSRYGAEGHGHGEQCVGIPQNLKGAGV